MATETRIVKFNVLMAGIAFFLVLTLPVLSRATLLGPADDYNVFLFGNMISSGSDTEGKVAAGGNINLQNYSVGLKAALSDYSLVSGGKVEFYSGTISNGGIYSGGDVKFYNGTALDGGIYAQGDTELLNVTYQGDIVGEPLSPVDFDSAYNQLSATSQTLAALQDTGTTTVKSWGAVYFEGDDSFNVFSISAADLSGSVGFYFDFADDAVAVVNISGPYNDFSNFGFLDFNGTGYSTMDVAKGQNILFNFYETTTLDINNIGVMGSILAPDAMVYGKAAVVNGTLVAKSLISSVQFNDNPFNGGAAPVPEPATVMLFGTGLLGVAGLSRGLKKK